MVCGLLLDARHDELGTGRHAAAVVEVAKPRAELVAKIVDGVSHEHGLDVAEVAPLQEEGREPQLEQHVVAPRLGIEGRERLEGALREHGDEDGRAEEAVGEAVLPLLAVDEALTVEPHAQPLAAEPIVQEADELRVGCHAVGEEDVPLVRRQRRRHTAAGEVLIAL